MKPFSGVSERISDRALKSTPYVIHGMDLDIVKYFMDNHPDSRVREIAEEVWRMYSDSPIT